MRMAIGKWLKYLQVRWLIQHKLTCKCPKFLLNLCRLAEIHISFIRCHCVCVFPEFKGTAVRMCWSDIIEVNHSYGWKAQTQKEGLVKIEVPEAMTVQSWRVFSYKVKVIWAAITSTLLPPFHRFWEGGGDHFKASMGEAGLHKQTFPSALNS